jgi:hypothetical protein
MIRIGGYEKIGDPPPSDAILTASPITIRVDLKVNEIATNRPLLCT